MKLNKLLQEIESLGIDPNNINISTDSRGAFDGRYNLVKRKPGFWEVFYGDKGTKVNAQRFETEDEACNYFLHILRYNLDKQELADKPAYWQGYRKRSFSFSYWCTFGIFIFSILMGLFFLGYQIYQGDINWMFWYWIGWIIVFGIIAFAWLDNRRYELFEYISKPVIFGIFIIFLGFVMVYGAIYLVPEIMAGDMNSLGTLITCEICCGAGIVCFYIFFIKEYVNKLINHIKSKKMDDPGSIKDDRFDDEYDSFDDEDNSFDAEDDSFTDKYE